ncbi:unnamed protein product [Kuraishia capsulata CBS 1993]|uniref:VanZ-like domain-containing protein n=1 Tax=Kuraishia capsulata CBS 1993 TaxID=1382522 RepID=W6MRF1_9ASCO|nr:uncharacterized protein KUCA_T00005314001 [Kuraishia capsulata CBS 1993]CDK29326.1 unnamed protein product [Kuraishia capsulata CBS 1993]
MRIRKGILLGKSRDWSDLNRNANSSPGFLLSVIGAAYLGFADISLQSHDKILHFCSFFILTGLFYWIWDSNSIRMLRNMCILVCTVGAGIGSEILQGLLPYRTFDVYDIVSNVAGSSLALILSEVYHKKLIVKKRRDRFSRLHSDAIGNFESQLGQDLAAEDDVTDDEENQDVFVQEGEDIALRPVDPTPIVQS